MIKTFSSSFLTFMLLRLISDLSIMHMSGGNFEDSIADASYIYISDSNFKTIMMQWYSLLN